MISVYQELMEQQKGWNQLFNKHRLSFVTQLPEHVADIFEGWKLTDIRVLPTRDFAYYAIFQKNSTEYAIFNHVKSLENPEKIDDLGCLRNREDFFQLVPLFESEELTREEMKILKPFFEEASGWLVKAAIRMQNMKKEIEFQLFEQEMKSNGVDHVIREKDGHIRLKIGNYTIPVGYKVPPKDE